MVTNDTTELSIKSLVEPHLKIRIGIIVIRIPIRPPKLGYILRSLRHIVTRKIICYSLSID